MSTSLTEYEHVAVVTVKGELTNETVEQFAQESERCIEKGKFNILVDCSDVSHIDSAGLETLLDLQDKCEEELGAVKLSGLVPVCQKILELTRLARRFEAFDDLESGVKSFS